MRMILLFVIDQSRFVRDRGTGQKVLARRTDNLTIIQSTVKLRTTGNRPCGLERINPIHFFLMLTSRDDICIV